MNTRRQFLVRAPLGFLVAAAACNTDTPPAAPPQAPTGATAGAPPTFGTGPTSGPPVSPATFAEAEKLLQIAMTPAERQLAADSWARSMAPYLERRTGPRKVSIAAERHAGDDVESVATRPRPPAHRAIDSCVPRTAPAPLPAYDDAIAFAPVTRAVALDRVAQAHLRAADAHLSEPHRAPRSEDPIVITLTRDHALARAKAADAEIAAGRYRGPLHGIPYGVKDLLDTAGIAHDLRRRAVPQPRARGGLRGRARASNEAGAVLIAKLSLGALALNDIWFGGQTMNPWLLEEGASGSSAGPGRGDGGGAGRLLDRQRDRRQHRRARDALRRHRSAPDVRPRAAHRRDDAVLVARQARADDAQRRGRDARAAGDHRSRRGRRVERAAAVSTSTPTAPVAGSAGRLLPRSG